MASKMSDVLGLPQKVDLFLDKKKRTAYPVLMRHFQDFLDSLAKINIENLWSNFLIEDTKEAVLGVLMMTFRDENVDELQDQINAGNFKALMELIYEINGIKIKEDDEKN